MTPVSGIRGGAHSLTNLRLTSSPPPAEISVMKTSAEATSGCERLRKREVLRLILAAQETTNRHLHRIEKQMTDLQQSVTDLQAAVATAIDALGAPVQALRDQLAKAQDDLDALQVQDDADKAALTESLQATSAAADDIEAQVAKLNDATTATPAV